MAQHELKVPFILLDCYRLPGKISLGQVTSAPQTPTTAPTPLPSPAPQSFTTAPAPLPTPAPQSLAPTPPPTTTTTSQPTALPITGVEVASVIDVGSTITSFGCTFTNPQKFVDRTTKKTYCSGITAASLPGIIVTPSHGDLSIVEGIRVYGELLKLTPIICQHQSPPCSLLTHVSHTATAHNNCPKCDAVQYIIEGRINSSSPWALVAEGDFDWIGLNTRGPNDLGQPIASTYSSADTRWIFTTGTFSNTAAFVEYKVTFPRRRGIDSTPIAFGELELPGKILSSATS